MHTEEIESLLRRARPPELPPDWKRQILGPLSRRERRPVFLRFGWTTLAACWGLILLLRATTPNVPQGTVPFDYVAFVARNAAMERLTNAGELDPPPVEPIHMELQFRLPARQNSPTPPRT